MDKALRKALEASPEGRAYLAAKKAAKRAKTKRLSPRKAPGRAAARAAREERNAETARIRATVDARDPICVICSLPAPEPWELHHVDSGSGKSQRQSERNCCKTHGRCHKRAHRGDLSALEELLGWFASLGYSETVAVLEHRITKVKEARAPRLPPPADPVVGCACKDVGGLRLYDQREFETPDGRRHSVLVCTKHPRPPHPSPAREEQSR